MYSNFSFSPLSHSFSYFDLFLSTSVDIRFHPQEFCPFPSISLPSYCFEQVCLMINLCSLASSVCLSFKPLVAFSIGTKRTTPNEKGPPYLHIWGTWHGMLSSLILLSLLSFPQVFYAFISQRMTSANKQKEGFIRHVGFLCVCVHGRYNPVQSRFVPFAASVLWQSLMSLKAKGISQYSSS